MIRTSDMTFAKNVLGSWSKILQDGKSPDDLHAYNYEYQTPQYQDGEIASVVAYIFDFFNDPNAGDYYLALICFYGKVGHEYRRKLLYRYCYRPEDLDKFKKMVGDFASDQQMRLNQQMQFELDEDDPVPDREDSYDQILQELNSGRTASRRKAHDDYLHDDRYGIHLSNDEKFGLAVLSAFEDAYGNEYTYTDGGPGDADGEVEGVYEHNGRPHLFIELTINHHKCRVAYASDDVNVEEDADVIRLDSDPARSAEMIHDTVENYIDEVYLNPDDYHYDDEF